MARSTKQLRILASLALVLMLSGACASTNKSPEKQGLSPKDLSIPAAPRNLAANAQGTAIVLSWDKVEGASSYNVYWSEDRDLTPFNGEKLSRIVHPTITHKDLKEGTTYYYIVTAVGSGGQSKPSREASATTEP